MIMQANLKGDAESILHCPHQDIYSHFFVLYQSYCIVNSNGILYY